MLTVAGSHEPVMPFNDVPGRIGAVVPAQKAGIAVNVGVTADVTVMSMLTGAAHWPASGVKV